MVDTGDDLRSRISHLIEATLRAVDPREAIRRHLQRDDDNLHANGAIYDLRNMGEVVLIAVGKAAVPMADAVYDLVGDRLTRGVVVTKYGHVGDARILSDDPRMIILESGHPVPDENSLRAGEHVAQAIAHCSEYSLVIACISGGASALMIAPQPGIRLSTMQAINDALLRSGGDIREMNTVRSRLDRLKGGGLVRLAMPGHVLGLVLSDVIGDPLDVIASGLTNDPHAHNILVANNTQACEAVAEVAREYSYETQIITTELRGEARERGQEIARSICASAPKTCLIYGGEPTVTIHGAGKGGRNQELALAAALELDQSPSCHACVISFGTDGTDGPTDAAGAMAFPDSVRRAAALGMQAEDYLARNDSFHFHQAIGDLIITGPTGTNVADVVIAMRD
jgi:glycerate 2-kinase